MNTTNMFIELLIIGFEAVTWFALLICTLFDLDWIPLLGKIFARAEVLVIAFLVGFAYLLGIIVDGIADALLDKWEKCIWQSVKGEERISRLDMYAHAVSLAKTADTILRYPRSRIRILRSSMLNLVLISILALLLLWTRSPIQPGLEKRLTWFIGIAGAVMVGLVAFGYRRLEIFYWKMVKSFYVAGRENKHGKAPGQVAFLKDSEGNVIQVEVEAGQTVDLGQVRVTEE